ncbi:MAG: hypothetical protein HN757_07075 [Calditrichaeota bacterium]|jgi:hypothetical protein|nr:hypothetical protein [Calditrichota bacterium]
MPWTQDIINHCRELGMDLNENGYVGNHIENLISVFKNWEEIRDEIGGGQGGELIPDGNGNIKFNAAHSSSALCVNNFAPFKSEMDDFCLFNQAGFLEARFEKVLPTGISRPNLDFYLRNETTIIGFESKYTEIFNPKLPNHDGNLNRYQQRHELDYLPNEMLDIIDYYAASDDRLYIDVAQLIKHSIGLINEARSIPVQPILVYIYWQPTNWFDLELFRCHEREIQDFKKRIGTVIPFLPLPYLEFWKIFETDPTFKVHIELVKERYAMALPQH